MKGAAQVKLTLPRQLPPKAIGPVVFAATGLLCLLLSIWTAHAIERFSKLGVRRALAEAGHSWAEVQADGLQVILTGTAPTEAMRFRALSIAGGVVDSARLHDAMAVADRAQIAAPEFKIEILRNDDGVSLIGLAPATLDRAELVTNLDALAEGDQITDMLEAADHPVPDNWEDAVQYAVDVLALLPRAKISVRPGRVLVTAISDSDAQKRDMETALRRQQPSGVTVTLDISAPRPVITPFTLRFLVDDAGARFDACSVDSDKARNRVLAAAAEAGVPATPSCTVGLGVPTSEWADAAIMGIKALAKLGNGSITFSDADIALIAGPEVSQSDFDRVVGELESNLPEVFSLQATQTAATDGAPQGEAEFVAAVDGEGRVDLSGRLRDELSREVVESFARARFGSQSVHAATRLDGALPDGWPQRVLVGLEALGELNDGKVTVRADELLIEGTSGSREASGTIARILSSKLGAQGAYKIKVNYDEKLDLQAALPSDTECVAGINAILAQSKITFEPGSATIVPEAKGTLDKIAEVMKGCADYPMEVGGHTDSQGREEMNLALSDQRARAVIIALQSRRILTGNLTAKGYGETVPVMANDTEENREKNRRIEFRLLNVPVGGSAEGDPSAPVEITVQTPDDKTIRPKKRPADGAAD